MDYYPIKQTFSGKLCDFGVLFLIFNVSYRYQITLQLYFQQTFLPEKWHLSESFISPNSDFHAMKLRLSLVRNFGGDKLLKIRHIQNRKRQTDL